MAQNKSLVYVCYDQSSTTPGSGLAWYFYNLMVNAGFPNVYWVEGGLNAWMTAGFPLTTGDDGGRVNGIDYPPAP